MDRLLALEASITPSYRAVHIAEGLQAQMPLELAVLVIGYLAPCDHCQEGMDPIASDLRNGICLPCGRMPQGQCHICHRVMPWSYWSPLDTCYDCRSPSFRRL